MFQSPSACVRRYFRRPSPGSTTPTSDRCLAASMTKKVLVPFSILATTFSAGHFQPPPAGSANMSDAVVGTIAIGLRHAGDLNVCHLVLQVGVQGLRCDGWPERGRGLRSLDGLGSCNDAERIPARRAVDFWGSTEVVCGPRGQADWGTARSAASPRAATRRRCFRQDPWKLPGNTTPNGGRFRVVIFFETTLGQGGILARWRRARTLPLRSGRAAVPRQPQSAPGRVYNTAVCCEWLGNPFLFTPCRSVLR